MLWQHGFRMKRGVCAYEQGSFCTVNLGNSYTLHKESTQFKVSHRSCRTSPLTRLPRPL